MDDNAAKCEIPVNQIKKGEKYIFDSNPAGGFQGFTGGYFVRWRGLPLYTFYPSSAGQDGSRSWVKGEISSHFQLFT
jgi:hypothetical protein